MVHLFEALRTSQKVAGSIPDGVIELILPVDLWPGVDSPSHRNEYKEYFLGGKDAGCIGLTFVCRPSCNLGALASWKTHWDCCTLRLDNPI